MPPDLFGTPEIATQPPDAAPVGVYRERAAYFTPEPLALAICQALRRLGVNPRTILEPGCGGGAFLRAFAKVWPDAKSVGVDIEPACETSDEFTVYTQDLFEDMSWGTGRPNDGSHVGAPFGAAIGNPPFDLAERFVRRALELVEPHGYVAFLLRISFLSSKARVPLYREHPLWRFRPIAGRPSFTGGGADTSEYGMFVWRKDHRGDALLLQPLEWNR